MDGVIPAVVYKSIVKRLLYQFKYEPNLSKLSGILGQLMIEAISQNESFYAFLDKNPHVVPIPLSDARLRSRGYNHAELLAYHVAQYFSLKSRPGILKRIRDTKPQYKLTREQRIKNIKGSVNLNVG